MDFATLYKEHYADVKATAYRYLQDNEDADDATQETFIKAMESLDNYDDSYSFRTWVTNICNNTCRDKLRQRKAEQRRFTPLNDSNEYLAEQIEDESDPLSSLDAGRIELRVMALMSALPDPLLEAFKLRFVDELSYREVAEKMGVPISTAKTRIRRARAKVEQAFTPQ
jgi:RNA polymerase sigma-70 factor (ECF subfamily)